MNALRMIVWIGCVIGLLGCSIFLPQLFAITGMSRKCIMLFDGQCRALAVQNPDGFVGQMDVACRRLDKEFVFHFSSVPLS